MTKPEECLDKVAQMIAKKKDDGFEISQSTRARVMRGVGGSSAGDGLTPLTKLNDGSEAHVLMCC